MHKLIYFPILFILFSHVSLANVISNDFLSADLGARASAMGSAFGAVADDPNVIFYNPAGLVTVKNFSVLSSYGGVYGQANKTVIAASTPLPLGTLGLGFVTLKVADMLRTDDAGHTNGTFSYGDSAYLLGYSLNPLGDFLSVGVTGKYIVKQCGAASVAGIGLDAGLLFQSELLNAGVTVRDIKNTPIGNDYYARQFRFSLAVKPAPACQISCDRVGGTFHYGIKAGLPDIADFQTGFGDGALTMGCSVKCEGIKLNVAFKKHELGESLCMEIGL